MRSYALSGGYRRSAQVRRGFARIIGEPWELRPWVRDAGLVAGAPSFPQGLNLRTASSAGEAVFGLDVLDRLVQDLKLAAQVRRTDRAWGPGVLGCAMWMDDPELIEVLAQRELSRPHEAPGAQLPDVGPGA